MEALWRRTDMGAVFMCGLPFSRAEPRPVLVAAPVPSPPEFEGQARYWSDFVVRADSDFHTVEDTFGKRIAFTVPDSQSGCVAALTYFMSTKGFTPAARRSKEWRRAAVCRNHRSDGHAVGCPDRSRPRRRRCRAHRFVRAAPSPEVQAGVDVPGAHRGAGLAHPHPGIGGFHHGRSCAAISVSRGASRCHCEKSDGPVVVATLHGARSGLLRRLARPLRSRDALLEHPSIRHDDPAGVRDESSLTD